MKNKEPPYVNQEREIHMNKKKRRMHEWINTYMAKSKGKGIQYKNQEIEKTKKKLPMSSKRLIQE